MRERLFKAPSLRTRVMAAFLVLALMAMLSVTPPVRAAPTDEPSINVTITFATYCDLDGNYRSDDVYVVLYFELGNNPYYEVYYLITLQLPSGTNYSYLVYMLALSDEVVTHNLFFDHATESGDYTVYVSALLWTPYQATDSAQYTFDPPGGSEGGKPTFGVY
ncbi:MAG: hypothetical protein ACTSX2_06655 [Candidatus Thorarchaeota archaeon]